MKMILFLIKDNEKIAFNQQLERNVCKDPAPMSALLIWIPFIYGSLQLSSNMGFRFHSVALNDSNDVADDGFDGKQMWEII